MVCRRVEMRPIAIGAVALLLLTVPVSAQQLRRPSGWGGTIVLAPLLVAHGGWAMRCNPVAAERADAGVNRIEKFLRLTELQRRALDDVRTAITRAANLKAGTCPIDLPRASAERLSFTVQRFDALHRAAASVEPKFEMFYASLNAEQKAQLDAGPRRWSLR